MIKVGILETGEPPADLRERFGGYGGMFQRLLGPDFEATTYDVRSGEYPASPDEQDAYMVTGSPAGVYDDLPWIPELKSFLQSAKGKAKLVGICFGHQIMAEAFGGRVEKSERGWGVGLQRYDVRSRADWMDDGETMAIPVSHQDQIVEQPPASRILASSDFTPYGVLAYEDQPAISFQCHPEFDPDFAKALIESRRDRLTMADQALASLDQPNDSARVFGWIRRFLGAEPS
nr:homoserine O-succinyltransferase [uncultured Sphingosinicella sp.]